MTHNQAIWAAVVRQLGPNIHGNFARNDIFVQTDIDPGSFAPAFQSMREDEPGGAPTASRPFRKVLRRIVRGRYELSQTGIALISKMSAVERDYGEREAIVRTNNSEGYFSPSTLQDERTRVLREIVRRQGQPEFREALLQAYGRQCAVTDCDAECAIEAAHIYGYLGPDTNKVENGLPLRCDIHTLFDRNLFAIDPDSLQIFLAPSLRNTTYEGLHGKYLRMPLIENHRPSREALVLRWTEFWHP